MPALDVSVDVGRVVILFLAIRTEIAWWRATFVSVEIGDAAKARAARVTDVAREVWRGRR